MIRARSRLALIPLFAFGLLGAASPAAADTDPFWSTSHQDSSAPIWKAVSTDGRHTCEIRRPGWLRCSHKAKPAEDPKTVRTAGQVQRMSLRARAGSARPATILNLKSWKLTGPVDGPDSDVEADEIKWPVLGAFRSEDFFHTNADDSGVVFRATASGARTPGSVFVRSELRERNAYGTDNYDWSNATGTHTMTITQAITHLPSTLPRVVAGQIHDPEDEVLMVRLDGSRLYIEVRNVNGTYTQSTLTTAYRLGTMFTVKIIATKAGIAVNYDGARKAFFKGRVSNGATWYFKAGCYLQTNTSKGESPDSYGEVVITKLDLSHS